MKYKNIISCITVLFAMSIFVIAPVYAENQSELYDQYVAKHKRAKNVKFRDDPTDVGGKAYEFLKATAGLLGVPDTVIDTVDFARSVKNEGLGSNVLSFASKIAVGKFKSKKLSDAINKMQKKDVIKLLTKHGITDPKVNDYQRYLLDYITETAPNALAQEDEGKAYEGIFIDVVTKLCKTCNFAHKAYELAKEAAEATDQAFDNTKTQSMFNLMNRAGFDSYKDFVNEFAGGDQLKGGARKALTLYHKSQNRASPTDEQVMHFIYNRYERWQKEIKIRKQEAKMLEEMKPAFLKLPDRLKKIFLSDFLSIYNDLLKHKGKNLLISGSILDKKIRAKALYLLKIKQKTWLNYKYHKALAIYHIGWGKRPAPPGHLSNAEKTKKLKAKNKMKRDLVMEQLAKLNHTKYIDVLKKLNVKSPDPYLDCLCRNAGFGSAGAHQFYHPDTVGKYNARYSCQHPGEPCVVAGYGCTRHPLPKDRKIRDSCMESNRLNMKKDKNGKIDPKSGVRLDDYIAKELQKGH